jgi:hypothetical protein
LKTKNKNPDPSMITQKSQKAIDEGLAQGVIDAEKAAAELKWTPKY